MKTEQPQPAIRFSLGQVLCTPGAFAAFERNETTPISYLSRHLSGDWGDVCEQDQLTNEEALKTGARLFSVYRLPDETKIWIITEAVNEEGIREVTTLLLPEEY